MANLSRSVSAVSSSVQFSYPCEPVLDTFAELWSHHCIPLSVEPINTSCFLFVQNQIAEGHSLWSLQLGINLENFLYFNTSNFLRRLKLSINRNWPIYCYVAAEEITFSHFYPFKSVTTWFMLQPLRPWLFHTSQPDVSSDWKVKVPTFSSRAVISVSTAWINCTKSFQLRISWSDSSLWAQCQTL